MMSEKCSTTSFCSICLEKSITTIPIADDNMKAKESLEIFYEHMGISADPLENDEYLSMIRACQNCHLDLTQVVHRHREIKLLIKQINSLVNAIAARVLTNEDNVRNALALAGQGYKVGSGRREKLKVIGNAILERFNPVVVTTPLDKRNGGHVEASQTRDASQVLMESNNLEQFVRNNNDAITSESEDDDMKRKAENDVERKTSTDSDEDFVPISDQESSDEEIMTVIPIKDTEGSEETVGENINGDQNDTEEEDTERNKTAKSAEELQLYVKCMHCDLRLKRKRDWKLSFTRHMISEHDLGGTQPRSNMPDVEISWNDDELIFKKLEDKLVCVKCKNRVIQSDRMKEHMRDYHAADSTESSGRRTKKNHACQVCGKEFKFAKNLNRHMNVHSDTKRYVCDICGTRYKHQPALCHHKRTVHDPHHSKNCVCKLCGKTFWMPKNLRDHMLVHTEEKLNMCDLCGSTFKQKCALRTHIKWVHGGEEERKFICDICGKRFMLEVYLQQHTRTHTGEKPFECDVCGKRFSVKNLLKNHLRNHDESTKLPCDLCGARFTTISGLHRHRRNFHHPS